MVSDLLLLLCVLQTEIAALSQRSLGVDAGRLLDDRNSGETEDTDSEEIDDDEYDVDTGSEGPRIPWNSTITRLLIRKSMNVLIDEEEDDDDDDDAGGGSDAQEEVPILDFPAPHDLDDIDCAWDDGSERASVESSLYIWDETSDRASSESSFW